MSPTIEIPFPPRPPEPPEHRVSPLWVSVEPRWEYREVTRDLDREPLLRESDLNALGDEHWELAGIIREEHRVHFYFKRERTR